MTIIVPVFNGAHVLGLTVPAVLAQPADAIVYVDDGSTDRTADALRRLTEGDGRVRLLTHPTNRGRASARNTGIAASRDGELLFLDADVAPELGYAQSLASALGEPGAVAAVARLDFSDLDPDDPYHQYLAWNRRGARGRAGPTEWRFFLSGVAAVRRRALERAGGFPENIPYGEDLALACRLAARSPDGLRYAPDAVARMYDAGDLDTAQAKLRAFARSLPDIRALCPDALGLAGLDTLASPSRARRLALRLARMNAPARLVRSTLRRMPRALRPWAVRYLLAHTLAAAVPDVDAP